MVYALCFTYAMNKKLIIILIVIMWALYTIGNALRLNFPNLNIQSFGNKFSLVHFTAPGNNFVGSTFRLTSKSITGNTISLNGDERTCTKQMRWLYFNSQRGKRLRPLDSNTLTLLKQQSSSYDHLTIEWWLYTSCTNASPYSVFWSIRYTRWGKVSYIVAGTQLNYINNKIVGSFADSFQYFDNKVLIWYIYDSNWGIGYVWWSLTGHGNLINFLNNGGAINSGFMYVWNTIVSNTGSRTTTIQSENNAMETMRNLIIQWSVWLSKSINESERLSLLGNFQDKTVIYNGSDINSSTLINIAKQKAQALCQWQEPYLPAILWSNQKKIICVQNHNLQIDLDESNTYKDKTIIVKSGNVILTEGMTASSPALNLFVDKGLVYLPDSFTRESFNNEWFPATNGVSSWLYLKGNFIINGLVRATQDTGFNHKLHLQGKITMLNTPLEASTGKISQIETMFWSNTYNGFINLQNIFVRTCGLNGVWSDGTSCTTWSVVSTTPIVILNGRYPSNILEQ